MSRWSIIRGEIRRDVKARCPACGGEIPELYCVRCYKDFYKEEKEIKVERYNYYESED